MLYFPKKLESIRDLIFSQNSRIPNNVNLKPPQLENIQAILSLASYFERNISVFPHQLPFSDEFLRPKLVQLFFEDSTRTKLSFSMAAYNLGGMSENLDINRSSLNKGESIVDCLETLAYQGFNTVVCRSQQNNFLSEHYPNLDKIGQNLVLLNGGDGINEHPTQALLDLYTILKSLPPNPHQITKCVIYGDIYHSRVAHSLMELLPHFNIIPILFAPKELLPSAEQLSRISHPQSLIKMYSDEKMEDVFSEADVIYSLRIQKERHQFLHTESEWEHYLSHYSLTKRCYENTYQLRNENDRPLIFHPGPFNRGLEIDRDLANSKYFAAQEQVKNSIFVRMAILHLFLNQNYPTLALEGKSYDTFFGNTWRFNS